MNTLEFISYLRRLNVTLSVKEERLRCNAPPGVLTERLREEIARRKSDIIATIEAAPRTVPPTIPVMPRDRRLPLSFSQERLWILNQFVKDNFPYKTQIGLRLTGQLDTAALKRSLEGIADRHEILRTTFSLHEGEPAQIIAESIPLDLRLEDVSTLPPFEREIAAARLQRSEASRPFDPMRGPLIRPLLIRLHETGHILLVTIHHIIFDGWSAGIFCRELSSLYAGFTTGVQPSLPDLSVQYADFAAWQRDRLRGNHLNALISYWKERLENAPILQLPTDYPRPAALSFRGAHRLFEIPESLAASLDSLSRDEGVTPFMLLLAAFTVLLHRYSSQEDIVVGTPVAGRNRSEIEGLIGFFINTLVLRIDCSGDPGFSSLLRTVRDATIGALDNQEVPFEKLVEELQPERDTSHNPFFQVMLVFQNVPVVDFTLHGLAVEPFPVELETTPFDLTLTMMMAETGMKGMFGYSTDLFEAETIDRMAEHFTTLLRGIVENPDQRISSVPILTDAERDRMLGEWNDPLARYNKEITAHELFHTRVERAHERTAIVFEDYHLTYGELERRANRLAHHLNSYGLEPETPVGIFMERSPEMTVALLAVLRAGCAYVPLDPSYPPDRISFMIEDAGIPVVLTLGRMPGGVPETPARTVCIDAVWNEIERESDEQPENAVNPENLAYIIYTSGSTGRPKGVLIEHHGLCNLAESLVEAYGISCDERILQFASASFDASIAEIFRALISGGTLCVERIDSLLPGKPLVRTLLDRAVTMVTLPPSILSAIPVERFPALGTLIVAGEACPPDLIAEWADGRTIINAYGPTEASVCSTFEKCHEKGRPSGTRAADHGRQRATVPIGRPLNNTQAYILDRRLEPAPVGVTGELYIGGSGLARGYLNRPGLTAERFIPNPFAGIPGTRLYRTGDHGRYRRDGAIEFIGRTDSQVKIHGFRVELGEIDAALRGHEGVRDCVIAVLEDGGGARLVAYYVSDEALSSLALRRFLRTVLPPFMIPVEFVRIDHIPLTPSGKTDYKRLRMEHTSKDEETRAHIPPGSRTEREIAAVWSDLLEREKVGLSDNFFDVGGYSLLVIKAIARIEERLGVTMKVGDFIRLTLGQMAGACDERMQSGDMNT